MFAQQHRRVGPGQPGLGAGAAQFQHPRARREPPQVHAQGPSDALECSTRHGRRQFGGQRVPPGLQVGRQGLHLSRHCGRLFGDGGVQLLGAALHEPAADLAPPGQLLLTHGQRGLVLCAQGTGRVTGLLLPAAQLAGLRVELLERLQVAGVGRQAPAQPGTGLRRRLTLLAGLQTGLDRSGAPRQQQTDHAEEAAQLGGRRLPEHDLQAQRQDDERQQTCGVRDGPEGCVHQQRGQRSGLGRVKRVGADELIQGQSRECHQCAAKHPPRQVAQIAAQKHQYPVGRRNQRQGVGAPAQPAGQGVVGVGHEAGAGRRQGDSNPKKNTEREEHQPQHLTVETVAHAPTDGSRNSFSGAPGGHAAQFKVSDTIKKA